MMVGATANTVLIVDENADDREGLRHTLQAEGFRVSDYASADTALAALRDNPDVIGVILLDLARPMLGGWEFRASQLADAALRRVPTIVVTMASLTEADRYVLEVDDCLRKPVDPDQLVGIVGRYVTPELYD